MPDLELGESPDLGQYLATFRIRKWTVVIVVAMTVAIALMLSFRQEPIYRADVRMLIKPLPDPGGGSSFPVTATEAEVVASVQVASLVAESLGLIDVSPPELLGSLAAEPVNPSSAVMTVAFSSRDATFARDAANEFASQYIKFRQSQAREAILSARQSVQESIFDVERQIRTLIRDAEAARRQGDFDEVTRLEEERSSLTTRRVLLEQQLSTIPQLESVESGGGEILEFAVTPGSPASPNHVVNGMLGLVFGLVLGIGTALLRERLDDRFRGRPDVERALGSPVLATVPRYTAPGRGVRLVIVADSKGAASEAYRNLRTGVQFITSQREMRSLLITSPLAHEGKTSTTANLGVALSQAGREVTLVSGDLRRPQLEHYFGAESDVGLSTWLLGEVDSLEQVVLEHPSIPNLSLMTAGPIPSNPAELLTSPRLGQLLKGLEEISDLTLFDSPPVNPVADSVIIASQVDGVIMVVDAASTSRSAALHAKEQIERVGGEVIGCVLNAFDPSTTPYYYEPYYYSQYYSRVSPEETETTSTEFSEGLVEEEGSQPTPPVPIKRLFRSR